MAYTTTVPLYDEFREAITQSPKSRYAISKETGVSQSHLSQFMDGTKGLSIESLEKIAESLGKRITLAPLPKKQEKM